MVYCGACAPCAHKLFPHLLCPDSHLHQIKLREPATTDHMLDFLHRWQLAGGDAMFVELPASTCCTCGPGEGLCRQHPLCWQDTTPCVYLVLPRLMAELRWRCPALR